MGPTGPYVRYLANLKGKFLEGGEQAVYDSLRENGHPTGHDFEECPSLIVWVTLLSDIPEAAVRQYAVLLEKHGATDLFFALDLIRLVGKTEHERTAWMQAQGVTLGHAPTLVRCIEKYAEYIKWAPPPPAQRQCTLIQRPDSAHVGMVEAAMLEVGSESASGSHLVSPAETPANYQPAAAGKDQGSSLLGGTGVSGEVMHYPSFVHLVDDSLHPSTLPSGPLVLKATISVDPQQCAVQAASATGLCKGNGTGSYALCNTGSMDGGAAARLAAEMDVDRGQQQASGADTVEAVTQRLGLAVETNDMDALLSSLLDLYAVLTLHKGQLDSGVTLQDEALAAIIPPLMRASYVHAEASRAAQVRPLRRMWLQVMLWLSGLVGAGGGTQWTKLREALVEAHAGSTLVQRLRQRLEDWTEDNDDDGEGNSVAGSLVAVLSSLASLAEGDRLCEALREAGGCEVVVEAMTTGLRNRHATLLGSSCCAMMRLCNRHPSNVGRLLELQAHVKIVQTLDVALGAEMGASVQAEAEARGGFSEQALALASWICSCLASLIDYAPSAKAKQELQVELCALGLPESLATLLCFERLQAEPDAFVLVMDAMLALLGNSKQNQARMREVGALQILQAISLQGDRARARKASEKAYTELRMRVQRAVAMLQQTEMEIEGVDDVRKRTSEGTQDGAACTAQSKRRRTKHRQTERELEMQGSSEDMMTQAQTEEESLPQGMIIQPPHAPLLMIGEANPHGDEVQASERLRRLSRTDPSRLLPGLVRGLDVFANSPTLLEACLGYLARIAVDEVCCKQLLNLGVDKTLAAIMRKYLLSPDLTCAVCTVVLNMAKPTRRQVSTELLFAIRDAVKQTPLSSTVLQAFHSLLVPGSQALQVLAEDGGRLAIIRTAARKHSSIAMVTIALQCISGMCMGDSGAVTVNRRHLGSEGAIEAIDVALNRFARSAEVLFEGVKALYVLSIDNSSNVQRMRAAGMASRLTGAGFLQYVKGCSLDFCEVCLRLAANLALTNVEAREEMGRNGACILVLNILARAFTLETRDEARMATAALEAMSTLCLDCPLNVQRFGPAACEAISRYLQDASLACPSADMPSLPALRTLRQHACLAITRLLAVPEQRRLLLAPQVLCAVARCLPTPGLEEDVSYVEAVLMALEAMTSDATCPQRLPGSNLVQAAIVALPSTSVDRGAYGLPLAVVALLSKLKIEAGVVLAGLGVLCNLLRPSHDGEEMKLKEAMGASGACAVVAEILALSLDAEEPYEPVVSRCYRLITGLCSSCPANAQRCRALQVHASALRTVLAAAEMVSGLSGAWAIDIAVAACGSLAQLLCGAGLEHREELSQMLRQGGACEALLKLLNSSWMRGQEDKERVVVAMIQFLLAGHREDARPFQAAEAVGLVESRITDETGSAEAFSSRDEIMDEGRPLSQPQELHRRTMSPPPQPREDEFDDSMEGPDQVVDEVEKASSDRSEALPLTDAGAAAMRPDVGRPQSIGTKQCRPEAVLEDAPVLVLMLGEASENEDIDKASEAWGRLHQIARLLAPGDWEGVLPVLVRSLNVFVDKPCVTVPALICLDGITKDEAICRQLLALGVDGALAAVIRVQTLSLDVPLKACTVVTNMATRGCHKVSIELLSALLDAIKQFPTSSTVLQAFRSLLVPGSQALQVLADDGGSKVVVRFASRTTSSKAMVRMALECIASFCLGDSETAATNRQRLGLEGAVETIHSVMKRFPTRPELQYAGVKALWTLALDSNNVQRIKALGIISRPIGTRFQSYLTVSTCSLDFCEALLRLATAMALPNVELREEVGRRGACILVLNALARPPPQEICDKARVLTVAFEAMATLCLDCPLNVQRFGPKACEVVSRCLRDAWVASPETLSLPIRALRQQACLVIARLLATPEHMQLLLAPEIRCAVAACLQVPRLEEDVPYVEAVLTALEAMTSDATCPPRLPTPELVQASKRALCSMSVGGRAYGLPLQVIALLRKLGGSARVVLAGLDFLCHVLLPGHGEEAIKLREYLGANGACEVVAELIGRWADDVDKPIVSTGYWLIARLCLSCPANVERCLALQVHLSTSLSLITAAEVLGTGDNGWDAASVAWAMNMAIASCCCLTQLLAYGTPNEDREALSQTLRDKGACEALLQLLRSPGVRGHAGKERAVIATVEVLLDAFGEGSKSLQADEAEGVLERAITLEASRTREI